ncbi:MAG: hypothetical protein WAW31_04580 [Smithella sp.]
MVEMIKKYRPLLQMGVPTQFLKLTQEELKGITILGISGSAPLPKTVQEETEIKVVDVDTGKELTGDEIVDGKDYVVPSTIDDPSALDVIAAAAKTIGYGKK